MLEVYPEIYKGVLIPACVPMSFLPKLDCVGHKCSDCGVHKLQKEILDANSGCFDERKRSLVKQWVNKSQKKDGLVQTYLQWHYLRLSFDDLVDIYIEELTEMAEHSFMACWNLLSGQKDPKLLSKVKLLLCKILPRTICVNIKMSHKHYIGCINKSLCTLV